MSKTNEEAVRRIARHEASIAYWILWVLLMMTVLGSALKMKQLQSRIAVLEQKQEIGR